METHELRVDQSALTGEQAGDEVLALAHTGTVGALAALLGRAR